MQPRRQTANEDDYEQAVRMDTTQVGPLAMKKQNLTNVRISNTTYFRVRHEVLPRPQKLNAHRKIRLLAPCRNVEPRQLV